MKFEPGVFFNLPEDDYFSVEALSASGMKHLRVSPLDYWANSRTLNPNYEADQEDVVDSFAKTLGKSFHKRILEGREAFANCYAPAFDPSAYPDALEGADDIKAALRRHKEQGADVKITGNKEELIDRLVSLEPTAKIMDVLRESYVQTHEGKTLLATKYLHKIELAAAMIEKHPELSKAFTGGMPEVSIFWECPVIGVQCKARLDYLKPKAIVDLKTIANKQGRPLPSAVAREFAAYRYFVQGAFYHEAAKQIKGLMNAGKVYGEAPHDFLSKLYADHDKTVLYVFQVKGIAPAAIGRIFPTEGITFQIAQTEIETMKQTYRICLEKFGNAPWVEDSKIEMLTDEEVPGWAYD